MPDNYTPLNAGDQATAALFNAVFEELDDALGNVATLDTTATNVTDAINEVHGETDANTTQIDDINTTIATMAVQIGNDELVVVALSDDVYVSLDSDGTLKAGAVDVAAVLADGVVTTAKILDANVTAGKLAADAVTTVKILDANVTVDKLASNAVTQAKMADASVGTAELIDANVTTAKIADANVTAAKVAAATVPSGELNPDPRFTQFLTVSSTALYGKRRFYTTGTSGATISGGQMSLTLSGTGTGQEGHKIWGSEAGFVGGDVLSVRMKAIVSATATVAVALAGRQSDGTTLAGSATAGSTAVGTGAEQTFYLENYTLHSSAAAVDAYLYFASGSGTATITEISLVKGSKHTIGNAAASIGAGKLALDQIASILGSDVDLAARMTRQIRAGEDPFNRFFAPTSRYQDGSTVLRWQQGGGSAAVVENDTSNPFGLTTYRITPTYGRRYQLSELGWSVGDTVSFGALVRVAVGNTYAINYAFRNAAGGSTGAAAGTSTAGDGTVQWLSKTNITVPSSSVAVDVYFTRSVGTGTLDLYGIFAVQGSAISQTEALSRGYSQRYDPGAWWMRHQSLSPELNIESLQGWRTVQSQLAQAASSVHARIAFIGDSYTNGAYRYLKPLAARLVTDSADAGPGFVSTYASNYNAGIAYGFPPKLTSVARSGTWTDTVLTGRGADLCEAASSSAGAKYTLVWTGTDGYIHYLQGGGVLRFRIDGGAWTSEDTSGSTAFDRVGIGTVASGSHTLEVEVVSGTITLLGFELYDYSVTNGTVFHKLGYSGSKVSSWTTVTSGAVWRAALTALAPNLTTVFLGINDSVGSSDGDAVYKTNMLTLISDIRTAVAGVDLLLLSPPEFATTHLYEISEFSKRTKELSMTTANCAAIDLRAYISAYSATLFEDNTHVNATGGQLIGDVVYRALKR